MNLRSFIALIARREFVRVVRRRGFVLTTLLVPASLALVVGITSTVGGDASTTRDSGAPIYLVNESSLPLRDLPASSASPAVHIVTSDAATSARAAGETVETYLVPADFLETGSMVRVVDTKPRSDFQTYDRLRAQETAVTAYLRRAILLDGGLTAGDLDRVTQAPSFLQQAPGDRAPVKAEANPDSLLVPYLFALLFVLSIMMTSGYLLQSVSEEKENRVVEIVLASVPTLGLMAGKLLGLGAAGMLQILIWVASVGIGMPVLGAQVPFLADMAPSPAVLALAVVYFVLGYAMYGAIYCAAGAIGSNMSEATQFASVAGMVAALPIPLMILFAEDKSSPVAIALALFPLTAPAAALQIVSLAASPPWLLVALSLVLLAVGAVVTTVLAARVFRASTLLAGTTPSLRKIAAAVLAG
jgi:ABC-2 type transport system permease protein